jgi:hypothetical protein
MGYTELELANLLRGLGKALTERRCLSSLREIEQDEDGQADNGGESGISAGRGGEVANS